jgi:hypothetical protein
MDGQTLFLLIGCEWSRLYLTGGMSRNEAARQFGVSIGTAINGVKLRVFMPASIAGLKAFILRQLPDVQASARINELPITERKLDSRLSRALRGIK